MNQMSNNKFGEWIELFGIRRCLVYETAFDGIVKIYLLEADDPKVNSLLKDKFFGDYCFLLENGILLREFPKRNSWPKTYLTFLNMQSKSITRLQKIRSSYLELPTILTNNGFIEIEIKPNKKIIVSAE